MEFSYLKVILWSSAQVGQVAFVVLGEGWHFRVVRSTFPATDFSQSCLLLRKWSRNFYLFCTRYQQTCLKIFLVQVLSRFLQKATVFR